MKTFFKGVTIVFILIGLYLILSNGVIFNSILKTIADSSLKGVAVLQGRSTYAAGV